jgi:hypothetical protein
VDGSARATDHTDRRPSRRRLAVAGIALAAMVAGGFFALLLSGRNDAQPLAVEASPTPSAAVGTPLPAAFPSPTPTPSPVPTAAATPTPDWPATPAPEPIVVLEPVGFALNTIHRLSLRAEPGLDGERLGSLSADSVSAVLDGPVSADGYIWYQLSGLAMPPATGCAGPLATDPWGQAPLGAPTVGCPVWLGWVAAASLDGEAWLVPVSREEVGCPSSPLAIDAFWSLGIVQPLGCFAGQEITVRGLYPELPPDFASGIVCEPARPDEVTWLMCPSFDALSSDDTYWEGPLILKIDPASGVRLPERGQWLEVTGFYDHPLARRCGDRIVDEAYPDYAAGLVRECRSQFVVSGFRVVSRP